MMGSSPVVAQELLGTAGGHSMQVWASLRMCGGLLHRQTKPERGQEDEAARNRGLRDIRDRHRLWVKVAWRGSRTRRF